VTVASLAFALASALPNGVSAADLFTAFRCASKIGKSGFHLKIQIPTRGFKGRYKTQSGIYVKLRKGLSEMEIGESSEWPMRCEAGVRVIARRLGIKVVTRRLGRLNKITIYRVE